MDKERTMIDEKPPSDLPSSKGSYDNIRQSARAVSMALGTKLRQRGLSIALCSVRPIK